MSFYIDQFITKMKKNDKIVFVNGEQSKEVMVNLDFLSHYTSFFQPKNELFVDSTYEIPFDVSVAANSIEHVHNLFITLGLNQDTFFKNVKAYDYFCIDVQEVYEHLSHTLFLSETILFTWTKEAIDVGEIAVNMIDLFYNSKFFNLNFNTYSTDKDVILYLLKRKWLLNQPIDRDLFIKKSRSLEMYLFKSVMMYMESNKKETYDYELFAVFWKYIQLTFLPKEALADFSNHPLALAVFDDVSVSIHQKYNLFSCKQVIENSRFYITDQHLKWEELSVDKKIQAMDKNGKWYNGMIFYMAEYIIVKFDNFSSKYNEIFTKYDMHKLLPYGTIEKDHICPCKTCISEIFKIQYINEN